jgi:hypothetical protein
VEKTYEVSYTPRTLYRSSGGKLQEEEININDKLKVQGKLNQITGIITARKLTDQSIKYQKVRGTLGETSDTEDTFILETSKGDVTVNLEDNTDTIHEKIKQKENPLTKAEVLGIFNSNTMKIYGTRWVKMWSR